MTQTESEYVQVYLSRYLTKINNTPALLSLLYDANMLPEQIVTEKDAKAVAAICIAYGLGSDAAWCIKQQQYANWIMQLMGGDTHFIESMMETLREDGMVDENYELTYGQEDDE